MRLTLNIERSEYLDIISPEFGARILIHPLGTLPSLERGGITLSPGSKNYISIRMVPTLIFQSRVVALVTFAATLYVSKCLVSDVRFFLIAVRIQRKIERLPEPYRGCSKSFNDTKITPYLRDVGLDNLLQRSMYTFDVSRRCTRCLFDSVI